MIPFFNPYLLSLIWSLHTIPFLKSKSTNRIIIPSFHLSISNSSNQSHFNLFFFSHTISSFLSISLFIQSHQQNNTKTLIVILIKSNKYKVITIIKGKQIQSRNIFERYQMTIISTYDCMHSSWQPAQIQIHKYNKKEKVHSWFKWIRLQRKTKNKELE